ncbi:restriction endonuclease subunit S [Vibrio fluvialis]|nr:restriction endonuclease subunit S [Vibrio fluvialis]
MTDKQTVKFGDICKEVNLTTKDPIGDGYECYIGLEHLDSGSLKIKRWGMIADDSPSFTRVFKKGQILLGKRRPYLKKAAIAEFDGICSSDIIVIEPKDSLKVPSILPFIVQSEKFWNHAVKTSSGSLSPRTKFSALINFELQLQSEPALMVACEALKKIEQMISFNELAILSAENLWESVLIDFVSNQLRTEKWKLVELAKLADVIDPQPDHRTPKAVAGGVPYVGIADVEDGQFNLDGARKVSSHALHKQIEAFDVHKGAFIYGKIGTIGNPTRVSSNREYALSANVILISSKEEEMNDYLYYLMKSIYIERQVRGLINITSQPALGIQKVRKILIPSPKNIDTEFSSLIAYLRQQDVQLTAIRDKLLKIQSLKSVVINNFYWK